MKLCVGVTSLCGVFTLLSTRVLDCWAYRVVGLSVVVDLMVTQYGYMEIQVSLHTNYTPNFSVNLTTIVSFNYFAACINRLF